MKIERTNFEKLSVYKLAERLSDEAWAVVIGWDLFPKDTVGQQLVRAADSIGANIAEAQGGAASWTIGVLSATREAR